MMLRVTTLAAGLLLALPAFSQSSNADVNRFSNQLNQMSKPATPTLNTPEASDKLITVQEGGINTGAPLKAEVKDDGTVVIGSDGAAAPMPAKEADAPKKADAKEEVKKDASSESAKEEAASDAKGANEGAVTAEKKNESGEATEATERSWWDDALESVGL
jgi:hypothetical protein